MKCTKGFKHVILLHHDLNRALFTRHGLHLNKMGNNVLVRNIALISTKIFYRDAKPTYLPWKAINNDHDNEIKNFFSIKDCTVDNVMLEISKPQTLEPQHKSNRQRKFPLDMMIFYGRRKTV